MATVEYRPFEKVIYDVEDVRAGPHQNTPRTIVTDGLGRTVRVIEENQSGHDAVPIATKYSWDLLGGIVRVEDAQGNVTTAAFDGLGRRTELHHPDAGRVRYLYDSCSNVVERTDARGVRTTLTYDGINRVLSTDFEADGSVDIVYHYDAAAPDYPGLRNLRGSLAYIVDPSVPEFRAMTPAGTSRPW